MCIQVAAEQKLAEKKYTQALRLFELSRVGFSKGLYDHNTSMFTNCCALCVQHISSLVSFAILMFPANCTKVLSLSGGLAPISILDMLHMMVYGAHVLVP